jgi:hypothetical protein
MATQHDVVLCLPKRNEWHIGGCKVPAEAIGTVAADDEACQSGFEQVISHAVGSIAMVPDGCEDGRETLDGLDKLVMDARVAQRNT